MKTIVVTGGSRGLGQGMVETFLERGHRVATFARSIATQQSERMLARPVDVTDPDAVERFADAVGEAFGTIDLWINNAGVLEPVVRIRDLEQSALANCISINVQGVVNGMQSYRRHLERNDAKGTLVNISSGAAQKGYAAWGAYCATKAAVDRLTECFDLEENRVRCFALAPGVIDTDMQKTIRSLSAEDFPMVDKFRKIHEDGAFNSPAYVAREIERLVFEQDDGPVVQRLAAEQKRK